MKAASVVSWNVLADAYIHPEYYPHTPPAVFDPTARHPALVRRLVALDADVLCLQEVERPLLAAATATLEPLGYAAEYVPKAGWKPDGCATLWRTAAFARRSAAALVYEDANEGEPRSGHVASLVTLERDGRLLGIANTHARWDRPGTPREQHRGLREVRELCARIEREACRSWIVCGDLNADPANELVAFLRGRGLRDPFPDDAFTCNSNGKRKKIDWLFHTPDLVAAPGALARIADETPLPSSEEPSDHLPLRVSLEWR